MIVSVLPAVAIIAACYVIGSIPTAYLVVKKIKGIDIRTVGSGNVGASNAARVLGKWGFIGVLFVDMMKGFIPVFVIKHFYGEGWIVLIGAVAVIIGHSFTCFLKFKGGKGVATGVGVFLALAPFQLLVAAVIFGIMLAVFQIVSIGSVTAAAFLAVMVWFTSEWDHLRYITVVIALLIIWLHRGNIARMVRGEERRIGKRTP
ncbi:glycerol-3-phosphate 1-O-acyltransferase PlsY [Seleniivibrio sp.]|uniref:glycerol-3-phosphate 1-O-acyltransferase PlsY n=1 Tax=Seleniivibrio sp. TaxID=2898801 RepID=UPI0025E20D52|nr:glycerol-3-phosphate 1-O-acyltransferase PlsY [Seleniivibrio sp.]MCD8554197.1 glycerol-3-phosphate 1-O-acyltransferase PlsY [Seleniivibrio sp.]